MNGDCTSERSIFGLTAANALSGIDTLHQAPVRAVANAQQLGVQDLVIVAVKGPAMAEVAAQVAEQLRGGSRHVMGVMIESHLVAGSQKIPNDLSQLDVKALTYGQSITDACIDLSSTRELLSQLAAAMAEGQTALLAGV